MNTSISALRALTSVTFQQLLKPATWIIFILLALLYLLVFYLGFSINAWWLAVLIVLMPITLIAVSLLAALWYLSGRLMPRPLLPSESEVVEGLVDKVKRLIEARATPVPVIMFMIAKDVVRGKGSTYIENLISDSKGLGGDFAAVKKLFEKKTLS